MKARPTDRHAAAITALTFNEHRRLYMGIGDSDVRRLSQVYDLPRMSVRRLLRQTARRLAQMAEQAVRGHLPAAMEGRRVLCIGDSNSSFRLSYVNVLRVALEPLGVPVIDASIPGCTSQDVVDHFRDQVPVHERDIVLIMIGTNDVRRANDPHGRNITSLDEFDGNLQFLVGRLLLARATPILISIPPIDSATMNRLFFPCDWVARESDIESYNNRIRNCAGDHALPFIDFNAALRGPLAPEILADGLHLRPEAHVLLAGMAFTRMAAL